MSDGFGPSLSLLSSVTGEQRADLSHEAGFSVQSRILGVGNGEELLLCV